MHVISLFSMLFCLNLYCDGLKVLFTLKFLLLKNDLFHFTGCEDSLLCVMDSLVIQINTYERILERTVSRSSILSMLTVEGTVYRAPSVALIVTT